MSHQVCRVTTSSRAIIQSLSTTAQHFIPIIVVTSSAQYVQGFLTSGRGLHSWELIKTDGGIFSLACVASKRCGIDASAPNAAKETFSCLCGVNCKVFWR